MKRLLINGSPRGRESNSRLILSWIIDGLHAAETANSASAGSAQTNQSAAQSVQTSGLNAAPEQSGIDTPETEKMIICDLRNTAKHDEYAQLFAGADEIVFAMPLYTDSMPGIVKSFFEKAGAQPAEKLAGKRIFFIIQSGFPESIHCETLGAYCARFAQRHRMIHGGTILKGGIEGVRIMPEKMVRKTKELFVRAGKEIAESGAFSSDTIKTSAAPRTFKGFTLLMVRFMSWIGINNFYWNMMLKKNSAFDKRFDAPYGQPFRR